MDPEPKDFKRWFINISGNPRFNLAEKLEAWSRENGNVLRVERDRAEGLMLVFLKVYESRVLPLLGGRQYDDYPTE